MLVSEDVIQRLDPFIDWWVCELWRHVFRAGVLVDQEPLPLGESFYVAMRMAYLHDANSAAALVSTDWRNYDSDCVDDCDEQGCNGPNGEVWPRASTGELSDQFASAGPGYRESVE